MDSNSAARPNPRIETSDLEYLGCGIEVRRHISHYNMGQPWELLPMNEQQIKREADRLFEFLDSIELDSGAFTKKREITTVEQAAVWGMLQVKEYRDRYHQIRPASYNTKRGNTSR